MIDIEKKNIMLRISRNVPISSNEFVEVSVHYITRNAAVPEAKAIWPVDVAVAVIGEMVIPCPTGNCWRITTDYEFTSEEKTQLVDYACDMWTPDEIDARM